MSGPRCRCLDCGYALSETAVSWPSCKPLQRQLHKTPQTSQPPGARSKQSVSLNLGSGTHLDAPSHFVEGGRTVDQLMPQELAAVPLALVDVSEHAGNDADYACDAAAVAADEAKHGPIPPRSFVCIRTGWAERHYASREREAAKSKLGASVN